jgi:hypothetical protein
MWHKVISDLSSLFSKLWPYVLSGVVGSCLTAGFLYLFKRRDERREFKKKLTAELYSPARRQLAEAEEAVRGDQRAFSINAEMWKQACSSGVARKLKPQMRLALASLYERTLPNYDKAWQELNYEVERLGRRWDEKFADLRLPLSEKLHAVRIVWWKFLIGDAPVTPIDGLRDGDVLQLWDCFMTPARFKLLDRSPEQFLGDRWQEAAVNDAVKQFRGSRKRALEEIPRAIKLLDQSSLY